MQKVLIPARIEKTDLIKLKSLAKKNKRNTSDYIRFILTNEIEKEYGNNTSCK